MNWMKLNELYNMIERKRGIFEWHTNELIQLKPISKPMNTNYFLIRWCFQFKKIFFFKSWEKKKLITKSQKKKSVEKKINFYWFSKEFHAFLWHNVSLLVEILNIYSMFKWFGLGMVKQFKWRQHWCNVECRYVDLSTMNIVDCPTVRCWLKHNDRVVVVKSHSAMTHSDWKTKNNLRIVKRI